MLRRLVDMILRRAEPPTSERSTKANRLAELAATTVEHTKAAHEMARQSQTGSYGRVSIGPKH